MNKVLTWIIIISFCMVVFNVSFNLKYYLNSVSAVFDKMPAFPNWSIDWESFSITNWGPLGRFFECIYLTIKYFIDLVLWAFDLVFTLFGFKTSIKNYDPVTGAGGGHGGAAG